MNKIHQCACQRLGFQFGSVNLHYENKKVYEHFDFENNNYGFLKQLGITQDATMQLRFDNNNSTSS